MNARAKKAWRDGIAPALSVAELEALRDALRRDDPALVQGVTALSPAGIPGACIGCCALAYPGWSRSDYRVRSDAMDAFDETTIRAKARLGTSDDPSGSARLSSWLTWYDAAPRAEMRRELLSEIEPEIERRKAA